MASLGRGRGRGSGSAEGSGDNKQFVGTVQPDLFTRDPNVEKQGTSGRKTPCYANFIPLEINTNYFVYQYHLDFVPSVDSKHCREKMLLHKNVVEEINDFFVFDGMILYMTKEWENCQTIEVPHPITGESIAVRFKFVMRYKLNDPQMINTLNTIIRRCFDQLEYVQLGRHYFNKKRSVVIPNYKMSVLPGFETAIRMHESQLMLAVENRFKMLRNETMLDLILKENKQNRGISKATETKINELFSDTTIMTAYNNKLHRFTRLDYTITPLSKFEKDGVQITLKEYFQTQYNRTITHDDQPIIISEGKPKQPGEPPQINYLVPELCHPTGLTDEMRKDTRMMKEVAKHTRINPEIRLVQTRALAEELNNHPRIQACFNYWGIQLDADLAKVEARVLNPERLIGVENRRPYTGVNAEWARGIKEAGIYRASSLKNWIVIAPNNEFTVKLTMKFMHECQNLGRMLNVEVGDPITQGVEGVDAVHYLEAIRTALKRAEGHEIHAMVVILADDNKTRYDSVKKFLCVEAPVPSQCVNLRTLAGNARDGGENKNFSSIVLKIFLQMVCKNGGALWKVHIPLPDTMLIGYDLYHDSTLRGKTVGACVSTFSSDFTEFYSQTRPHENPTQLGTNLTHFVRKALRKYYDSNDGRLPTRIILYRDGAGDGQIPYIRNTEVKLVKEACEYVAQSAAKRSGTAPIEIKFAFIIVTKRVNMRILKPNGSGAVNPEPGTVVDDIVTRPERMDFYLIPQNVNQGTVTPVSYNVIYDSTNLGQDKQQLLAFKLCHMYYNWQGTVRVPALCQYAHKLAFLTAQTIHEGTHETLRNRLFFL